MNRRLLSLLGVSLLFFLTLPSLQVQARPGAFEVEWQQQLPGTGTTDIVQSSDGGYAVLGASATVKEENGYKEYVSRTPLLTKTDSKGNMIWQKTFESQGIRLELNNLIKTTDGGYAVGGVDVFQIGETTAVRNEICLIKLDNQGNEQWRKLMPSYNSSISAEVTTGDFRSLIQTNDGGFAMVTAYNYWMYITESWFVKTDSSGNLQFSKSISSGSPLLLSQSEQSYTLVGSYFGRGGSGGKITITQISSEGNTQWSKDYGDYQQNPYATSAAPTSDGGYIVACQINVNRQSWVIRVDIQGTMLWNKTYAYGSNFSTFESVTQTKDDGFLFAGDAMEPTYTVGPYTLFYTWIVKTDGSGKVEGQHVFSGSSDPRSTIQSADGSYIFAGTWRLNDIGNEKIWLVKLKPQLISPDTLPPPIVILSPQATTYPLAGNISLTYFADNTIATTTYSIDNQPAQPISENTTIIGLPAGSHTLTVYGEDAFGNLESAETTFTVGSFGGQDSSLLIVGGTVIVVAIVSFALGVYLQKRRTAKTRRQ